MNCTNARVTSRIHALTERIIGCAFTVSNLLGHGFLESVYQNALVRELILAELMFEREKGFSVNYRGYEVGRYIADLIVENAVVVELKAIDCLSRKHTAQVVSYLKANNLNVGLLLNFGQPTVQVKRVLL